MNSWDVRLVMSCVLAYGVNLVSCVLAYGVNLVSCVLGLKHRSGLSWRSGHVQQRSDCLNKFSNFFGFLPLKTSRITVEQYE